MTHNTRRGTVNTDRMRRNLARRSEEADAAQRRRWLAGLPAEHRQIHEKFAGPCMICVRDSTNRIIGEQFGQSLASFGLISRPPRIPPPMPAEALEALPPETYRRPDGRADVAWMEPHVAYVMGLHLTDAEKQNLIDRLDQVAVRAFEDAAEESGHVAELRQLLDPYRHILET